MQAVLFTSFPVHACQFSYLILYNLSYWKVMWNKQKCDVPVCIRLGFTFLKIFRIAETSDSQPVCREFWRSVARGLELENCLYNIGGTWWRSRLSHCATSRKVAGPIPDYIIGIFSLTQSFQPHDGCGVDSAGRCVGLTTLPPSCVEIMLKSGSLNLPESSGTVQPCNGIALPFIYITLNTEINLLKTKRRLLYLKAQFVPRSKHF